MKLRNSAAILPCYLFVCQGESREGRTKTEQAWDFACLARSRCRQGYKAALHAHAMEKACIEPDANEILLSGS